MVYICLRCILYYAYLYTVLHVFVCFVNILCLYTNIHTIHYTIICAEYAEDASSEEDVDDNSSDADLNLKNKPKLKQNLAKKKTLLSVLSRPVIKSKINNTTATNIYTSTTNTTTDNKYIYIEREKTVRELAYEEAKSARILERSSRKPRTHGYLYTYNTTTGII